MSRVVECRDIGELDGLRADWQRLLSVTPRASFAQSWPWLAARWRQASPDSQWRVLVMKDDVGQLTGIMPLVVETEKTRLGNLRVLMWPHDRWNSFYGPVGGDPGRTLREGLDYLRHAPGDHDVADLHSLRQELLDVPGPGPRTGADGPGVESTRVAMVELTGTWREYWASRKRESTRARNVERCVRRIAQHGHVTYLRYRPAGTEAGDGDPRWDLYDACEELSARSWQAGLVEGNTLSHPRVRGLLRDAHVAAADAGGLDMNMLYLNERLVAFGYGYHFRGYVDLLRIGFDPVYAKLGPGNVLWCRLIADSFERSDRWLDLGPSCMDYKHLWMTDVGLSFRITRYRLRPRAQLVRLARWLRGLRPRHVDDSNRANKRSVQARLPRLAAPA